MGCLGEQVIRERGKRVSRYEIDRVLEDGRELYKFKSRKEWSPRGLWMPTYIGQTALALYVAKIEIVDKKHPVEDPLVTYLQLTGEQSLYARSDLIEVRDWAGSNVSYHALRAYLHGELTDSPEAREFYESLTDEQLAAINNYAVNATLQEGSAQTV